MLNTISKRSIAILMAVVLCLSMLTAVNFVEFNAKAIKIIIGDVNGDGKVNAQDRVILTRYLAKWKGYYSINTAAADVNDDGKINAQDRVILTRYLAKWKGYDSLPYKPASQGSKTYNVGIVQLVQHQALDAATKGFKDALTERFGDKVVFNYQNASGEISSCTSIVNSFVSSNVDLIMANATPALQAAASATNTIPVLGTSITEYGVALGIDDFNGTVGGNISGTSDLAPLKEQAKLISDIFPNVRSVGIIYCSYEPNSKYQVDVVKAELEKLGITATLFAFTGSSDIAAVCTNAAAECDAIYVPTDNTVAFVAGVIDSICRPAKVPVICGDEYTCENCGTVTLSIDYYDLGYATGKMAAKILADGADISTMEIEYAPNFTKKFNAEICAELGIALPSDFVAI